MVSILFIIGPDRLYPCRSFPDSHYHLVLGSLPVSAVIEPTLLPQFLVRDGECFSSCLASPCFRAATTARRSGYAFHPVLRVSMLSSPGGCWFGLRIFRFRGHLCVRLRCGPETCSPALMAALSLDSRGSPSPLLIKLQGSGYYPGRSVSC